MCSTMAGIGRLLGIVLLDIVFTQLSFGQEVSLNRELDVLTEPQQRKVLQQRSSDAFVFNHTETSNTPGGYVSFVFTFRKSRWNQMMLATLAVRHSLFAFQIWTDQQNLYASYNS